jgi:hypothetical protein
VFYRGAALRRRVAKDALVIVRTCVLPAYGFAGVDLIIEVDTFSGERRS